MDELLGHAAWLRVLARHLVDDAAAAEDLVQETWLAAIRRPPLRDRPVQPWLASVARRLAAFARRGELRRERREARAANVPPESPSTGELVARAELQRRLVEAVLALTEPYRSTLLLCYYEGLAPGEIARVQQVPAGTVRSRLKRGLDELRARFDAEMQSRGGVDWRGGFAPLMAGSVHGARLLSGSTVKLAAALLVVAIGVGVLVKSAPTPDDHREPRHALAAGLRIDDERAAARLPASKNDEPVTAHRVPATEAPAAAPSSPSAADSISEPVAFSDDEALEGNTLRTIVLRGRVLDPDGTPHGRARIEWTTTGDRNVVGNTSSQRDGSFELTASASHRTTGLRICATGERDGRTLAAIVVAPLDGSDVVVQLADGPKLRLTVRAADGKPVDHFRCMLPTARGHSAEFFNLPAQKQIEGLLHPWTLDHLRTPPEQHPEGRMTFELPMHRFLVVVEAFGFAQAVAGPFDPEPLPAQNGREIELVLERAAALSGRVVARGEPIAGAAVSFHAFPPSDRYLRWNDFIVLVDPMDGDSTQSDTDGTFAFPHPLANRLLVRAEAPGFAASEVEVADVDAAARDGITLELRPGGSILGVVVAASGETPSGIVVAASRGDLAPRFSTVGDDGRFRFDRLTPGRWCVEQRMQVMDKQSRTVTGHVGPRPELPWNCEVLDGGVTEFTLDVSAGRTGRLVGRVSVDGKAPSATISLTSIASGDGTGIDLADGSFQFDALCFGPVRVDLQFEEERLRPLSVVAFLDLHRGMQQFDVALSTASLELEGLPIDGGGLVYVATAGGSAQAFVHVRPDGNGRSILAVVPAGPGRLLRGAGDGLAEPFSGTTLLELDLKPGETRRARGP